MASLTASTLVITTVSDVAAQAGVPHGDELAVLRDEVRRLREELAEVRTAVARLASAPDAAAPDLAARRAPARVIATGPAAPTTPGGPPTPEVGEPALPGQAPWSGSPHPGAPQSPQAPAPTVPPSDPALALLPQQVAELAQLKVESTSKFPVKLFGTIHSSTVLNSGEANWLENPNIVQPPAVPGDDEGSFTSTLRQSRIGFTIDNIPVGALRASGLIAFDFFGGVPAVQTGTVMGLPRLLYGFARLEGERTALHVGQDDMLLAPREPTSLAAFATPDLFRSGNLYLRVPQVRLEHRVDAGERDAVRLMAALVAPVAGDFGAPYTFAPAAGAGERSRAPAFQGRVAWTREAANGSTVAALGASGHYGRHRIGEGSQAAWAGSADVDLSVGIFGFGSEVYAGDRLGAFGGGLGQQVRAAGGYAEARVSPTARVQFTGGLGIDRVARGDRVRVPLEENRTWFGNVIYRFTPELRGSVEYRWLETRPTGAAARDNHHVNWAFALSF